MSLKKLLMIILTIIFVFILVLLIRTFTYPFPKAEVAETGEVVRPDLSEESIIRFAGGIKIPTINQDAYDVADYRAFDEFKTYLIQVYPEIYKTMDTMTINGHGLVLHWKGQDAGLKPLLFLSHYDVVPVIGYEPEEGKRTPDIYKLEEESGSAVEEPISTYQEEWTYPPFSGAVANGKVYGRGTLDMKNMLFSLLEAADTLIKEGFKPKQDIWFAFGFDEESGGIKGAIEIASYFKEQNLTFDAVFDEGGIISAPGSTIESIQKPMALVGVGEKGLLTLRIKVKGMGGHSSMPPVKSSLVLAAEIIEKINTHQMPAELIDPIASFLDRTGSEMGFFSRLAIANRWLMKPLLLSTFGKSPASNALIRTTTAVTMAKGSDAPNVIASVAEVTANFRILPGNTVEQVINHVTALCEGYEVEIDVVSAREPSGLSPENSRGFEIIKEIVSKLYPDAIVSSYITIGGTDAYKYQIVSDNIYRFMPVYLNRYEQQTIHNENEHITLDNYGKMIWYFKEIMRNY
ncbi:MAG: M20/M25/M40 family metallo-hydrolase [Candidatus Azobacteroides sp.]|nr:M20/M25/M40 family metallo-hydrolase [Candidatus Azobacteroides sp.]